MVNPVDTPEKCVFPNTLASKLFVEALLPPLEAIVVLCAIGGLWHATGNSCGLRQLCDKKRTCSDNVVGIGINPIVTLEKQLLIMI
jgi:hypothetical protein